MSTSSQEHEFVTAWVDGPPITTPSASTYQHRALMIWPGIDRSRLRRTQGDPWKIARLVARRTSLSTESILTLLMGVGAAADTSAATSSVAAPQIGGATG